MDYSEASGGVAELEAPPQLSLSFPRPLLALPLGSEVVPYHSGPSPDTPLTPLTPPVYGGRASHPLALPPPPGSTAVALVRQRQTQDQPASGGKAADCWGVHTCVCRQSKKIGVPL